jgi:hypothetical protein
MSEQAPDQHESATKPLCEIAAEILRMNANGGKQIPGCLPPGYSLDSLLTVEQFARWQDASLKWVWQHASALPGVIHEGRKMTRFHPRTYLNTRLPLRKRSP